MRVALLLPTVALFCPSTGNTQAVERGESREPLPPIFAPRAAPPKPATTGAAAASPPARVGRAISPEMAAKLSAVAIQGSVGPPPAAMTSASPAPNVAPGTGDGSDAVQLKPFVVKEDRLPEFKQRDLLTPKGKLELARRRYPGLSLGPLNDGVALRMLEEDFAKERRQEMSDLYGLMKIGKEPVPRDVKRKIDEALQPKHDTFPQPGEPFRTPK